MICSNGSCGKIYQPNSVRKYKTGLEPKKNPYSTNDGPELIPLHAYRNADSKSKKKNTNAAIDREDEKMYRRPGFSWISKEDY